MPIFQEIKDHLTARQVAEHYGLKVGRNGMACCPFHNDRTPSMKIDKGYYCFGCQAHGDAIGYVAQLSWEEVGQILDTECSSVEDVRLDLEKTIKGTSGRALRIACVYYIGILCSREPFAKTSSPGRRILSGNTDGSVIPRQI